jgi:hypothetical protein
LNTENEFGVRRLAGAFDQRKVGSQTIILGSPPFVAAKFMAGNLFRRRVPTVKAAASRRTP